MNSPTDSLQGRYGGRSRGAQVLLAAFAAVIVVSGAGWLLWAMLFHANPEISSSEIGHEIVDDHLATVKVKIEMDKGLKGVDCSARAISVDKEDVGTLKFTPDPAQGPIYTIDIRTSRRATTVEWVGCNAEGQPRYR
ncbi:MAG: DUF4307 domain-containing protein [Nocardioidaceae bacterium]|nr:DUF4307 domain-containing protein [Nocardioidaceae bacterium]